MSSHLDTLLNRQFAIAQGDAEPLPLPKFDTYTICNLRGGIGKTSLTFNLTYLSDDILAVDACPQCNLTYFFDNDYLNNVHLTIYNMLLPAFVPGLGTASHVAKDISATNEFFEGKNSFYIPSDTQLYVLPSQVSNALFQAKTITGTQQTDIIDAMLFSLRDNLVREMKDTKTSRCIIDTSPFFSGATHLALHACDALIVPVRTDQQSINSLSLLMKTLSDPASEFRRNMPSDQHCPKIQMIVLTHCGWSTVSGSRNRPNQQTKVYVEKVLDIIRQYRTFFTSPEPSNHLLLLDDFLGTGRISSAKSKPIELLHEGESATINRVRVEVNASVEKVKNQLKFIKSCIF